MFIAKDAVSRRWGLWIESGSGDVELVSDLFSSREKVIKHAEDNGLLHNIKWNHPWSDKYEKNTSNS